MVSPQRKYLGYIILFMLVPFVLISYLIINILICCEAVCEATVAYLIEDRNWKETYKEYKEDHLIF